MPLIFFFNIEIHCNSFYYENLLSIILLWKCMAKCFFRWKYISCCFLIWKCIYANCFTMTRHCKLLLHLKIKLNHSLCKRLKENIDNNTHYLNWSLVYRHQQRSDMLTIERLCHFFSWFVDINKHHFCLFITKNIFLLWWRSS